MTLPTLSSRRLRIVVTGLIAQHPSLGGVAWDYLQFPAGLRRLGHDVYYVEDSGEWPYNLDGGPTGDDWVARDPSANVAHLADVMRRAGLDGRWAYRFAIDGRWFGLADAARNEVLRTADLILNVSGTLEYPEEYRGAGRLAYLDSDPIFTQIKLARADDHATFAARVNAHDVFFSFGEALTPEWRGGRAWWPTRQPVLLDEWATAAPPARGCYTTVMSWTSYQPLHFNGRVYGQKDVEFEHFMDLPARVRPVPLEVAVGGLQHAEWEADCSAAADAPGDAPLSTAERLRRLGWSVVDPLRHCTTLDSYRHYIWSSRGEWSVAKNGYVRGESGWFSCRSACYLASGRPVVVQDTGFGSVLPVGDGLLAFRTPDDAAAAIVEVERDYDRHARAARDLAHAYFDAQLVLNHLVERAMASQLEAVR